MGEKEQGFVFSLLAYFFKNTEIAREKINRFIKKLPENLNPNAMSTYDMIKAEGKAEGIEFEKREFIHKLWSLQEFSLEKIAFLVGVSIERVTEVIVEFLQKEGLNELEAKMKIEQYSLI